MRLPVIATGAHKGKWLELDRKRETIRLLGARGEPLGIVTWESVIDLILGLGAPYRQEKARPVAKDSHVVNVRYSQAEGHWLKSWASWVGDGGLFIESSDPLPIGTKLAMEFALPDSPSEWMAAKGTVVWVCPKADQYTFSPGMGVRFTDMSTVARERASQRHRS